MLHAGNTKGGSITVLLTSCLISLTTENISFYIQNTLIQTGQTGGQQYNDTSPFSSIPWRNFWKARRSAGMPMCVSERIEREKKEGMDKL